MTAVQSLELKIPPPVAAALAAAAMWLLARQLPALDIAPDQRVIGAAALAGFGILLAVAAALAFRRASTTIHPADPTATTALVTGGVFRYTRNPMYLGLGAVLLGWAVYLVVPLTLLGPAVFAIYVNRFQIVPEERALRAKFGKDFTRYQARVRRWL